MSPLAERMSRVRASLSSAAAQRARELRAAGRDILNLGQGEPDFATPEHVIEAAHRAMRAGETRYTNTDGTPELKAAIVEKFRRENGLRFEPDEISVGAGAKQVIFNALMATLDPGDEVLIPAPHWLSYPEMVAFAEGRAVIAPTARENDFKLSPAALEAAITPRTKWLILNAPSNPAGTAYTLEELRALAAVLERHPRVWILADDIYEHILFDGRRHATMAQAAPQLASRTLTVNGVSKAYAMTGWRIGYGAGPSALIRAMGTLQSQSTANPSSIGQAAALAALTGPQDGVRRRSAEFERRRDALGPQLAAIPGLACGMPHGAFYFFVSCAGFLGKRTPEGTALADDEHVALYLLDEGVALVHGAPYGASPYIRVSFATSMENLAEAGRRIARAGAKLG
ncbi:MAG: pyridoxal phosphate-dependent aminotransferase [Betaproteobacteria bacterium]|nr:MAG: pyridoxal phosphate-dependent aminotransferase [Betaproteobacteria bacterium]